MKLIVGLGNPGKEYENTRHNVGFMVIDKVCKDKNITIDKSKYDGCYSVFKQFNDTIILLKPQKYMNLSGEVVKKFMDYYNINVNDILIINDDLDLPVGKIKLKPFGSSGGHNGLKNIEYNIGTNMYKRLKIGVSNNKKISTKDYVLGRFEPSEYFEIEKAVEIASNIVNEFTNNPFDILMTKYNHK